MSVTVEELVQVANYLRGEDGENPYLTVALLHRSFPEVFPRKPCVNVVRQALMRAVSQGKFERYYGRGNQYRYRLADLVARAAELAREALAANLAQILGGAVAEGGVVLTVEQAQKIAERLGLLS